MKELFGIPMDTLLSVLLGIFGFGAAVVGLLALRNRVAFRMAVRNVPRRKAQTALIVSGLMLATLLFSASFTTGDTLTHSGRVQAVEGLGEVDVHVRAAAGDAGGGEDFGPSSATQDAYFDAAVASRVRAALAGDPEVAGVAPIALERAPVVAPGARRSEPEAAVLGLVPDAGRGFAPLSTADGGSLAVGALGADAAYVSAELARNLDIAQGGLIQVFLGERPAALRVAGVYEAGADPGGTLSLVVPLARLQALTGNEGEVNGVVVTHAGGPVEGAAHTDRTLARLEPVLRDAGLSADPVKRDALDRADAEGGGFTQIFTILGGFSVAAGIMMIFLIFVMLAAERKRELGIARGVGMQRAQVVRMFTFEGAVYSLLASAVGSALGVAVGWMMVRAITAAFAGFGFEIVFAFTWRSLVIAYTLGMVITFAVVVASSWRVSRLNVVRAIRDIPEPTLRRKTVKGLLLALGVAALGGALIALGVAETIISVYMLGISLAIIGAALLARRLGLPDRAAFSAAGLLLLAWWLLPDSVTESLMPAAMAGTGDIEMFLASGISIVLAAVWVVMYNSDVLLRAIIAVFGRVRGLPPVLKTAVSYPTQNRFRTGMTLAMISLVMFTLVTMSFITTAFGAIWDDTDRWGGGYDIRANGSYANPVSDTAGFRAVEGVAPGAIRTVASLGVAPVRARHDGTGQELADLGLQGADESYLRSVRYTFRTRAAGYDTDRAVWAALASEPNLAVVSSGTLTGGEEMGPPEEEGLTFEGVTYGDGRLPAHPYALVRDPESGREVRLRVIGILDEAALFTGEVVTSARTLEGIVGRPVPPQSFYFQLADGASPSAVAGAMERQFLANGLQAEPIRAELDEIASSNDLFYTMLQGFMALGLIVGIAALGVIAARAVVERRQQIGVLRAMGFQKSQVQLAFLLESSFVALLGIGLGLALGGALSRNVIAGIAGEFTGVRYIVPWVQLALICALAYAASLLTTFLPARQASKVYPAEALRFE